MNIDDFYKINTNNDSECYARGKKKVMVIAGIFAGTYVLKLLADISVINFIILLIAAAFAYFMFKGVAWIRNIYIGSNLLYGVINIFSTIASASALIKAFGGIGYISVGIAIIVSLYGVISAGILAFSYDVGTYFQHNS
jgi:hypothetical protein